MSDFFFDGDIPASKSLFNRALIVKSYLSDLEIIGHSESDDVQLMKAALSDLASGRKEFQCGHAGTVLRFFAFRLSREKGHFVLRGSKRLFSRPQKELVKLLSQLGCDVTQHEDRLEIQSFDWKVRGDGIFIDSSESSQFASGLLLNAWNLEKDFYFHLGNKRVSEAYFQMTLDLVKSFGLNVEPSGQEYLIRAGQSPKGESYSVEADVSSAFSIAAVAVVGDRAVRIRNFPQVSLQPDQFFVSCLKQMGVSLSQDALGLTVNPTKNMHGISVSLQNCPDLFPVLSVLCALADGSSQIQGVSHLAFKESHRIEKSKELLGLMGASLDFDGENVFIAPKTHQQRVAIYSPDQDHRMAMAAAVALKAGYSIQLQDKEVVNKSFPEFWKLAFS